MKVKWAFSGYTTQAYWGNKILNTALIKLINQFQYKTLVTNLLNETSTCISNLTTHRLG
jgi:hypothetical protein